MIYITVIPQSSGHGSLSKLQLTIIISRTLYRISLKLSEWLDLPKIAPEPRASHLQNTLHRCLLARNGAKSGHFAIAVWLMSPTTSFSS